MKKLLILIAVVPVLALFGGIGVLSWRISDTWSEATTQSLVTGLTVVCGGGALVVAILLALIVGIPLAIRTYGEGGISHRAWGGSRPALSLPDEWPPMPPRRPPAMVDGQWRELPPPSPRRGVQRVGEAASFFCHRSRTAGMGWTDKMKGRGYGPIMLNHPSLDSYPDIPSTE